MSQLSRPVTSEPPSYWAAAVAHLSAVDPVMAGIIQARPGIWLESRRDPVFTLLRAIVGQQISTKAADTVWRRLQDDLGLDVAAIAAAPVERIQTCGLSFRKAGYILGIAQALAEGSVDPARWTDMADDAIVKDVTRIKGIGQWTAELLLIFCLERPDVMPLGDLGLHKAYKTHYGDQSDLKTHAERWRPYRSAANWYLWRSIDPMPLDY